MRRRRSRQVEIFNFSFLDILACTIGLLIFIMVMTFILQSGSPVADARAIVQKAQDRSAEIRAAAQRENQIADQLESQLGRLHVNLDPLLVAQRDAARLLRDAARAANEEQTRELARAEAAVQSELHLQQEAQKQKMTNAQVRLDAAKKSLDEAVRKLAIAKNEALATANIRFQPHAQSREDAARYSILHIDCRGDGIVLLEVAGDGTAKELGRFGGDDLGKNSQFARIVQLHQFHFRPLVLFWVRPDGKSNFEKAMMALPKEMERGYEPADADWKFINGDMTPTGDGNGTRNPSKTTGGPVQLFVP